MKRLGDQLDRERAEGAFQETDAIGDRVSNLQSQQDRLSDPDGRFGGLTRAQHTSLIADKKQNALDRERLGMPEAEAAAAQKKAVQERLSSMGVGRSTYAAEQAQEIDNDLKRSLDRRRELTDIASARTKANMLQGNSDAIAEIDSQIQGLFNDQATAVTTRLNNIAQYNAKLNLSREDSMDNFLAGLAANDPGSQRKVNLTLSDRFGYLVDDFGKQIGENKQMLPSESGKSSKSSDTYKLNKEEGYYWNTKNPSDRISVNDGTTEVTQNDNGTYSFRTSKTSDTTNMEVVETDSANGANCVLYAREQVNNLPYGLFDIEDKERAVELAGTKDTSEAQVGDAVLTREGKYGHVAVITGFDEEGNAILDEANYKSGQVTQGRALSLDDSTVIGLVPNNGGIEEPANIINRDNVDIEGTNSAPWQQSEKKAEMTQKWATRLQAVRSKRVTNTTAEQWLSEAIDEGLGAEYQDALIGGQQLEEDLNLRDRVTQSRIANNGKKPPAKFNENLSKAKTVMANIKELKGLIQSADESGDLGVMKGRMANMNPYNTNAAQFKALLQATVPNLARGIYGEVGVLTDTDIANYIKTLPNLSTTREIADMMANMTAQAAKRSIENTLDTYAGSYDVSNYAGELTKLDNWVASVDMENIPDLSSEAAAAPQSVRDMAKNQGVSIDAMVADGFSIREIEEALLEANQ